MNIIVKRYAGTRLGLQEIDGQILDDNPNALWKRADIDKYRVRKAPELHKIVIAIDPGVSDGSDPDAAEIGIVAAGVNYDEAEDPTYYVLEDASVGPCSPFIWASAAITCYHKVEGDEIIGEGNNGGALVGSTIEAVEQGLPYEMVTASRGKRTRAEPVSALYEKGRVHHVGSFPDLESQMCEWVPGEKSPDRMDALVWAITRLAQNDETFAASRI
jgi:phage terminase large subunit-like protein